MGLFQNKKIKLKKEISEGNSLFYIDYDRLKEPEEFLINLILDFTEDKNGLLVLDTDYFYIKNSNTAESRINCLKKEFDKLAICYREVVTKKEEDYAIMGLKIQKSKKVNNYKLGLAVTPDQLKDIAGLIKDCNLFYYVAMDTMDPEELLQRFYETRGEYEDLIPFFGIYLYNNCFFHRSRISCNQDNISFTENKLMKYQ
jgi:hypothetical protein